MSYLPIVNFSPLFIAVDKGLLKEQGIDAELTVSQGGADVISQLGTGQLDVSFGGVSAGTFAAVGRGIDVKLVAAITVHPQAGGGFASPFMIRKAAYDAGEIRSGQDLKGKKVALNARGGLAEYLMEKLLGKYGMTIADIEVVYLGFPEMVAALKNGAVDAALIGDPFANEVERTGIGVLSEVDSSPTPGLQSSLMFYSPKFIKERADVARRFLVAIEKAKRELAGDGFFKPDNLEIISKQVKLSQDAIKSMKSTTLFETNPTLDLDSLQDQQRVFIQHGSLQLQAPIPSEKLVDTSFGAYAQQVLGPYKP